MYIRRKVFSNVEQPVEEQLYSVTMTEEEYNLFSEFLEEYMYSEEDNKVAKGAAKGAAATAGAAGLAAGSAYGAGKIASKLQASRIAAAQKEGISLANPSKVEKILRNANLDAKNLASWAKNNKLAATGIAAGTLAAGAGIGAGVSAIRKNKNKKK